MGWREGFVAFLYFLFVFSTVAGIFNFCPENLCHFSFLNQLNSDRRKYWKCLPLFFFKLPMSFPPWIIIHLFLMRTWTGWNFWPQCFTDPLSILSLHQPSLTSTVKEKNENYCSDLKLISELLLVHIIGWKKDCSAVKW